MSNIKIQEMWFYYQDFYHPVFQDINLSLDSDWKLGLIGRNGRGKTTLLHLLSGTLQPSQGTIQSLTQPSYFPYEVDQTYTQTMDVIKETVAGLRTMEIKMEALVNLEDQMPVEEYLKLLEAYEFHRGYEMESLILKEMEQMELPVDLLDRDFRTLSGGEKTSILIIALFLRKDTFVLLDEPTNHLDGQKKDALARYLKRKKAFILVSHNLEFLDQCIDHVLAINKADITLEQGNYSSWKRNMEQKEAFELRTEQRLLHDIALLERNAAKTRKWSDVGNKQKYDFACNARANGARAYMQQAKRAEQQIQDNLDEKKQLLRNLEEEKQLQIMQIGSEGCLLEMKQYSYSFPECTKPIIENLNFKLFSQERIGIAGRNGVGKSTLLKEIVSIFRRTNLQDLAIWKQENINVAYAMQEPEFRVPTAYELLQSMNRDDLFTERDRASYFLELCERFDLPEDFLFRPIETLSSGEKKKLDLARCICSESHILMMDEPLNYMDVNFREQLTKAILEKDLTVVFVEHDERFLKEVATRIVRM